MSNLSTEARRRLVVATASKKVGNEIADKIDSGGESGPTIISGSVEVTVGTVAAQSLSSAAVSIPGAVSGDGVILEPPVAIAGSLLVGSTFYSAGVLRVQLYNYDSIQEYSGSTDTWKYTIIKQA